MEFLRDLPVLVLGLGDSGLAMARWCARHGAQVTVWDSREDPPRAAALLAEVPAAQRTTTLPASLTAAPLLKTIHRVLKPGGVLGIVDHHAPAGSGSAAAQRLHRIAQGPDANQHQQPGQQPRRQTIPETGIEEGPPDKG